MPNCSHYIYLWFHIPLSFIFAEVLICILSAFPVLTPACTIRTVSESYSQKFDAIPPQPHKKFFVFFAHCTQHQQWLSFSNTRPLSAFPARASSAQNQVTVDEFKNILTSACDYAVPSSRSKQYKRVKVLLTYWTEDDLGVKNEVGRLRDTFERGYRYDCTVEQIPAGGLEEPLPWMTPKLLELMEDTSSNDLLIFYYAGHGRSARTPNEGPCVFL